MPRYSAFLRGVSPLNAKMADLKRAFESAGFCEVKTVLSSGNVAFNSPARSKTRLARQAEAAMAIELGRVFYTIMRPSGALQSLVDTDPYEPFTLPDNIKRIVTFLGEPRTGSITLPIEVDDGRILAAFGGDILSVYAPGLGGSKVMRLIEKTFGPNVTTRTWETVRRCADA